MVVICQSIFKVNKIIIARTPEEFLEVVRLEFYLNNRHHIITSEEEEKVPGTVYTQTVHGLD